MRIKHALCKKRRACFCVRSKSRRAVSGSRVCSRLRLHRGAEKRTESHRCKRFRWSGIQPLSIFGLFTSRKFSSPCTGEPRNAPKAIGVNAITGRGYNPSVFLLLRSKNPAPLAQGSREACANAVAGCGYGRLFAVKGKKPQHNTWQKLLWYAKKRCLCGTAFVELYNADYDI